MLFQVDARADIIFVTSQQEFDSAHDNSELNDTIVWRSGTYSDIFMDIDNDMLFIMAEKLGSVIFNGASRVDITGDYITLQGFQFVGGDIGTRDVINTRGSFNVFTQINIRAYRSYKYLRVREESQYTDINYCNFENRINLDDQNILSILVDNTNPGYHKIRHCSFKNFDGTGNDLGIEPIRIGVSTQAEFNSRSVVEYCYFTRCNGDGEIISSKASQNVYRHNTFEDNPLSELVLRHGSESIVYGNFFLDGKGGVRVREGQNHYIYNNYFHDIEDRPIYLQNDDSDPLDNINIAFNTIVECSELILGGSGNDEPTNVTLSNNIFVDLDSDLFEEQTGTETWLNNIYFGSLGIPTPSSGITLLNPQLEENSKGFFGLSENSPAINRAEPGYALLPDFEGVDDIDTEVLFDLMRQDRPASINERDLGCNEFPHEILIQPIATEENTGPSYNTSVITSLEEDLQIRIDNISIAPNPVSSLLNVSLYNKSTIKVVIDIINIEGKRVDSFQDNNTFSGELTLSKNISNLPFGMYTLRVSSIDSNGNKNGVTAVKFVKSN